MGELLRRPGKFFAAPSRGGWAEPLAFGLITGTLGMLALIYWEFLVCLGSARLVAGMSGVSALVSRGGAPVIALMVFAPLIVLANIELNAWCLWGALALLGSPARGLAPALRLAAYAQAGMIIALIPILGLIMAGFWVLVLMYKGVRGVCGFSGGRALAVLATSLALQVFISLLFLGILVGSVGLLGLLLL